MGEGSSQPPSPSLPASLAGHTVYYSKGGIWPAGQGMGGHCKEVGLTLVDCIDPVGWNLMAFNPQPFYFEANHLPFSSPLQQGLRLG